MGFLKSMSIFCGLVFLGGNIAFAHPLKDKAYGGDLLELGYVFVVLIAVITGIALYTGHKRRMVTINHFKLSWPYPLVITRETGRVTYCNEAFKGHIGQEIKYMADLKMGGDETFREQCQSFISQHKDHEHAKKVFHFQGGKGYAIRAIKQDHEIFWYFDGLEQPDAMTLFNETEFQRSLETKYLYNKTPAGTVILDDVGRVEGTNFTFQRQFNNQVKPEIGLGFQELLSDRCLKECKENFAQFLRERVSTVPLELEFKNGHQAVAYFSELEFPSHLDPEKMFKGYYLQIFDNIEQKQLQQRLAQSQKLQALGQLAGGIAHDFNNLLTAIIGFCDLLLMRHAPGDQSFTDLMQIKQNANRATNLVRQLLAFSKQQSLQPKLLDVSEMIADLSLLLQRLIGRGIELKISHGKGVGHIKADQGQFEQVIINLIVNARDAIAEKGTIRIVTALMDVKKPRAMGNEMIPNGSYIQIEVMDDGMGISQENINRIFDPFFSTKDLTAGTGLGLSTVYGIVKQSGGFIFVDSTPKVGTKFTILFPQCDAKSLVIAASSNAEKPAHRDLTGSGSILLAEDEEAVRLFAARALGDKGYQVIEASDGFEALGYLKNQKDPADYPRLLITDVVMPHMDGPTLVREARKLNPQLKVLFISGYAEDSFRDMLSKEPGIQFLAKPFNLKDLALKVKGIIEDMPEESGALEKVS